MGKYIVLILLVLYALRSDAETAAGMFSEEIHDAATPIWQHAAGGALLGIPTVQAGTVVAIVEGGGLRAYTLEGRPLWNYYARSPRLIPYVSRNREGTSYV